MARAPRADEVKRLVALYEQELAQFKQDAKAAEKMATSELGKPAENMSLEELAAWTVVANVLLNLDETNLQKVRSSNAICRIVNFHHRTQATHLHAITRRHFFSKAAWGIGGVALASLLNEKLFAAKPEPMAINPLAPKAPHFAPKAKRVIYMFMEGAPSQLDLFDFKPKLVELNMKPCPEELIKGERFAFIKGIPKILGTPHKFARHGQCGMELSALLPHLASVADDITLVRSMVTDAFNHAPAQIFLNSGSTQIGRPSMGSWLNYGLGSESQNLPGFVVMLSGGGQPSGGAACWSSGFLPTVYQGVQFRSQGDPVLFLSNPGRHERAGAAAFAGCLARFERDGNECHRRSGNCHPHQFV